jgi:thiosulfate/3-mercaptopyruvate sulfurtransferase
MNTKLIYTPSEADAERARGKAILIDVRSREDFDKAHIPNAVNIPEMFTTLSMSTEDGLQEMEDIFVPLFRAAGIRHDQTVIVYEEALNTRYGGSCRGYFQLSLFGHPDVGILDGGLSQWIEEGLPVTSEPTLSTPSNFEPRIRKDFVVSLDEMIEAIDNPAIKILDNRDEDEWRGVSSSPYGVDFAPRKGRIPGARWVEWYQFMDTSKAIPHFKTPEEIRSLCAQVGMDVDDDIIIYCFKGARASNTYIALKLAGFNRVRNYYGSWNEWSRHPELPIDAQVLAA